MPKKKYPVTTIYFNPELLKLLKNRADAMGTSVSTLVNEFVNKGLQAEVKAN